MSGVGLLQRVTKELKDEGLSAFAGIEYEYFSTFQLLFFALPTPFVPFSLDHFQSDSSLLRRLTVPQTSKKRPKRFTPRTFKIFNPSLKECTVTPSFDLSSTHNTSTTSTRTLPRLGSRLKVIILKLGREFMNPL